MIYKHGIKLGSKWKWNPDVDLNSRIITVTGCNMNGHIVYEYEDGEERHKIPSLFIKDFINIDEKVDKYESLKQKVIDVFLVCSKDVANNLSEDEKKELHTKYSDPEELLDSILKSYEIMKENYEK